MLVMFASPYWDRFCPNLLKLFLVIKNRRKFYNDQGTFLVFISFTGEVKLQREKKTLLFLWAPNKLGATVPSLHCLIQPWLLLAFGLARLASARFKTPFVLTNQIIDRTLNCINNFIEYSGLLQVSSERDVIRDQMVTRQEDELKEMMLSHAGEPANKIMKQKKKLQQKHEKGWDF